ncbi:CBS domain-containing protein [Nocardia neocaledoniensis]|uniref:CBS domain-containing protein n=1 Tax=Nocardia neocaledoniensis TaxID=236511 RepID=UPI0033E59867
MNSRCGSPAAELSWWAACSTKTPGGEDRNVADDGRAQHAWLVRAGSGGEQEGRALGEGLAFVGWDEMGDLGRYRTWQELKAGVRAAYPEASGAVVGNWAGQLWKFGTEIVEGDLVVMPLKAPAGAVAVGRVTGPYEYRPDEAERFRQVREVEWVRTNVPWEAIRSDLRASLGSLLTVCGLRRHNAAVRIAQLAVDGTDPGYAGDEAATGSDELLADAGSRDAGNPRELTVRSLLEHWGFERRTAAAVALIKSDLAENGLTTRPPFTEGPLSEVVAIVPLESEPSRAGGPGKAPAPVENVAEPEPMTRRLGSLPARLVSVPSNVDLTTAKTTMVRHQYSQLAVIDDLDGTYHGAITWESIGRAHIATDHPTLADATVPAVVVDHDAPLLDQIEAIYDHGFIFVRDPDRVRVSGILTAADLTHQFGTLAKPFVLIEEAENRLRRAARDHLDAEDYKAAAPRNRRAHVTEPEHLTFGGYVHLLQSPTSWRKLGWRLDQSQVIELVEQVRVVRNELMHFATDPLSAGQEAAVHGLLQVLRTAEPNP